MVLTHMELFRAAYDPSLRVILEALATACEAGEKKVQALSASNESDIYKELVLKESTRLVQGLFGTGFVACQTYITAVVASAKSH